MPARKSPKERNSGDLDGSGWERHSRKEQTMKGSVCTKCGRTSFILPMPSSYFVGPICIHCGLELSLDEPNNKNLNQQSDDAPLTHRKPGGNKINGKAYPDG